MQSSSTMRVGLGVLVAALGVVLVFSPGWVRDTFARPAETIGQKINLRATFGGAIAGLGGWVIHASALRPVGVLVAKGLLWLMSAVAAARVVGFVLDGQPDGLQWTWLVAEVLIAGGAIFYLRRRAL
jgi:hypothetical protein